MRWLNLGLAEASVKIKKQEKIREISDVFLNEQEIEFKSLERSFDQMLAQAERSGNYIGANYLMRTKAKYTSYIEKGIPFKVYYYAPTQGISFRTIH